MSDKRTMTLNLTLDDLPDADALGGSWGAVRVRGR